MPVHGLCSRPIGCRRDGFPLLPTFLGEDLLLHETLRDSGVASAVITGVLALNGYLAVRNFAFTFLGQRRPGDAPRLDAARGMVADPALDEWTPSSRVA